jgi:hypothetical protein
MKKLKDPIGNWSRDIPVCGAGPQQTALPRVPTFITNTRVKQTRPPRKWSSKNVCFTNRCPRAWTKSIVRSIPRQYTEVSGAHIDIVLWVVTCYLTWIGTRITNTELLRQGTRFGHPNISRKCSWTRFRWTLESMVTCSRREKALLLPRSEPWSCSISVPMLSKQATGNLINLRENDTKRRWIWRKSYRTHKLRILTFKTQRLLHQHINNPRKLRRHLSVLRHSLNKGFSQTALTCWSS